MNLEYEENSFKLLWEENELYYRIKLNGKLHIGNAASVKRFHHSFSNFLPEKPLFFDLSELENIDSSGLGTIFAIMKSVENLNGQYYFVIKNDKIKTSFRDIFKIQKFYESFEEAKEKVLEK